MVVIAPTSAPEVRNAGTIAPFARAPANQDRPLEKLHQGLQSLERGANRFGGLGCSHRYYLNNTSLEVACMARSAQTQTSERTHPTSKSMTLEDLRTSDLRHRIAILPCHRSPGSKDSRYSRSRLS